MHEATIHDLLSIGVDDAPAIGSPGHASLTFRGLRNLVARTRAAFNLHGIGRSDRVAIVLANGPHMATAFLSVACSATAAPLNPDYRAEEFEFYLSDLKANMLLVHAESSSPAIGIAIRLGVPIARLRPVAEGPAGDFTLDFLSSSSHRGILAEPPQQEDVALVLHTSGTTSRPKVVPLTQRNISASVRNVRTITRLRSDDRGINIMPLFHIHGLIAGLLAPLSAGGEVSCTTGFNALKFYAWMSEVRPTWYTAVPTMHQAIVARAPANRQVIMDHPLRFIRSSSSALPPRVICDLETIFTAPVIESYGMTEATHQMTSNPLPPAARKPGSVGTPAGPEVAVLDDNNEIMASGGIGEIAIRGDNVVQGYENNPDANLKSFTGGWFRTGDQGYMDADGYVFITGRLKEIINRGGEKISPREIDEVLLDHPAVAQCVTFAVPHEKLGEDVAAAITLKEGTSATERDLRDFAATRVADFKVPRKILILAEIPKGSTGKLQRIGLAEKLGLVSAAKP